MVTAVDSSVLLDVLLNDPQHAPNSIAALRQAAADGSLTICETVLAEIIPTLLPAEVPQFKAIGNLHLRRHRRQVPYLQGRRFEPTCSAAAREAVSCLISL